MVRLPALRAWAIGATFCCLTLAQRALCAAAILARAEALNLRPGLRAILVRPYPIRLAQQSRYPGHSTAALHGPAQPCAIMFMCVPPGAEMVSRRFVSDLFSVQMAEVTFERSPSPPQHPEAWKPAAIRPSCFDSPNRSATDIDMTNKKEAAHKPPPITLTCD